MKKKSILDLVRECEASARRKLAANGNPPDIKVTLLLQPDLYACHEVLRLVSQLRSEIRANKSRAAALAGFHLGQTVLREAMLRPLAKHAERGIRNVQGARKGGKARALPKEKQEQIRKEYESMHPKRSRTWASKQLATKFEVSPVTIRKYLPTKKEDK